MLLSKTAEVTWNAKNKRYYEDRGYVYTKMNDQFPVDVSDLTKGSSATITLICDYCGNSFSQSWCTYNSIHNKSVINKDACAKCASNKAEESVLLKYGGHKDMYYLSNDKRTNTNLQKYGNTCVFASDKIKAKIIETNIKRYGAPHCQSNIEVRKKTEKTCRERYGVNNYVEVFKGLFVKDNSPSWRGGAKQSRVERATYEYNQWRTAVFKRDEYMCRRCGRKNTKGSAKVTLNAHHILNWKDNPDKRYDIRNGITLCDKCHLEFHKKYSKKNNSEEQIAEFLNS